MREKESVHCCHLSLVQDGFVKRDAAFSMDLPFNNEGVQRIITICGKLLVLSKSKTVEVVTADSIDPSRNNPSVPHINRLLFNFGHQDDPIARTLIQFDVLVGRRHPPIVTPKFERLTLNLAHHLSRIEEARREGADELLALESAVNDWNVSRIGNATISAPLPQSRTLFQNLKTVIGETAAIIRGLEEFIRDMLPPDVLKLKKRKQPFFDFLLDASDALLGDVSELKGTIMRFRDFIGLVVSSRNAIEHPSTLQYFNFLDFRLSERNAVLPPAVSIKGRDVDASFVCIELLNAASRSISILAQDVIALISYCEVGKKFKWGLHFYEKDAQNGGHPLYRFTFAFADGTCHPLG